MAHSWNHDRAATRINKRLAEVKDITVLDFTREMSLDNIPVNRTYRMDGVHLYADILNLDEMLDATQEEGVDCHRRTLRFLNQHYRAVHRILKECDALRVDFHNQRLHSVVAKPYGDDELKKRVSRAVAIADLSIEVLKETGDFDAKIPAATVRVGIDTGRVLVVNNGRTGNREPLFLGQPANHAAKLATHDDVAGIFLSNSARKALGLTELKDGRERSTSLTREEIDRCVEEAALDVTKEHIVKQWRKDLEDHPIGEFEFSRHTPPLRTLEIEDLSPKNSRRVEAISVYADIDGFTKYVSDHIDDRPEDVVRTLHVVRSELDSALSTEFDGRRIRFIGDCLHGALLEGTAYETDTEASVSTAALCAGALRSSFDLCLELLGQNGVSCSGLGLAIGFEHGPLAISRLGMQGDRVRCCIGRGVLASEEEQSRCNGVETAIGDVAYDGATDAVRALFGKLRKIANLDYDAVVDALAAEGDEAAKSARDDVRIESAPTILIRREPEVRPHCG